MKFPASISCYLLPAVHTALLAWVGFLQTLCLRQGLKWADWVENVSGSKDGETRKKKGRRKKQKRKKILFISSIWVPLKKSELNMPMGDWLQIHLLKILVAEISTITVQSSLTEGIFQRHLLYDSRLCVINKSLPLVETLKQI